METELQAGTKTAQCRELTADELDVVTGGNFHYGGQVFSINIGSSVATISCGPMTIWIDSKGIYLN
jgi:hypothetical protein